MKRIPLAVPAEARLFDVIALWAARGFRVIGVRGQLFAEAACPVA